jgi:hypothetical protein
MGEVTNPSPIDQLPQLDMPLNHAVKRPGKGSPRPRLDEAPYDLTIQIRGAKKTGKSSLRKRLCGEEFDFSHYAPTVATEEAVFDWIYYSPQGQVEVSVPVKIADVVDLDADGELLEN